MLKDNLDEELDWDVRIAFDMDLEDTNVDWPAELAKQLSQSAVLVPLWTRSYFRSKWCTAECSHMYKRQNLLVNEPPERRTGLIAPAIIHDGREGIPRALQKIQAVELSTWTTRHLPPNSDHALNLERRIKQWAPKLAEAIRQVPKRRPEWAEDLHTEFIDLFWAGDQPPEAPSWNQP